MVDRVGSLVGHDRSVGSRLDLDRLLKQAIEQFAAEAALDYWFEVRKGIDESLRDFL